MLPAKYIAFITYVWLVGSIFGAIIEGAYLGQSQEGVLNRMAFWQKITEEQDWGFWEVVGAPAGLFDALFDMLSFKFAFIPGTDWELYSWIVGGPIVALFVYGLIMTVIGIFQRQVV